MEIEREKKNENPKVTKGEFTVSYLRNHDIRVIISWKYIAKSKYVCEGKSQEQNWQEEQNAEKK